MTPSQPLYCSLIPSNFLATLNVSCAKNPWSISSSFTYDCPKKWFTFATNVGRQPPNIKIQFANDLLDLFSSYDYFHIMKPLKIDKSVFSVVSLEESNEEKEYWFSRTPYERLRHLEQLRRINYGRRATSRLQRVLEHTQLT